MDWCENVIIADADYIDKVAFHLTVNFERMIMRRIPKADLAKWIDCVALDGGVREGEHQTQAILIHDAKNKALENFAPGDYDKELNGKAFKDNLGEFQIASAQPEDELVSKEDYFMQALQLVTQSHDVRRIMVIPDPDTTFHKVREHLNAIDDAEDMKRITVFTMQPSTGGNFRQEILGYSLMAAMGIKGDEIK
jgi:hypothetical protein